jgi:hypothetical protein
MFNHLESQTLRMLRIARPRAEAVTGLTLLSRVALGAGGDVDVRAALA